MATTSHFTTVEKFEAKLAKLATNHSLDYSEADEVILTRRLENAYNEILSALAARGLSVVQILLHSGMLRIAGGEASLRMRLTGLRFLTVVQS